MSDDTEIVKTFFEIFSGRGDVPVEVADTTLGMAYAIPPGTETTVAEGYSPWHDADVRQVVYQQSSIVGSVSAEIQPIIDPGGRHG